MLRGKVDKRDPATTIVDINRSVRWGRLVRLVRRSGDCRSGFSRRIPERPPIQNSLARSPLYQLRQAEPEPDLLPTEISRPQLDSELSSFSRGERVFILLKLRRIHRGWIQARWICRSDGCGSRSRRWNNAGGRWWNVVGCWNLCCSRQGG